MVASLKRHLVSDTSQNIRNITLQFLDIMIFMNIIIIIMNSAKTCKTCLMPHPVNADSMANPTQTIESNPGYELLKIAYDMFGMVLI